MIFRSLASFFAVLCLLGLLARVGVLAFDVTHLWIDLRQLPQVLSTGLLAIAGISVIALAINTPRGRLSIIGVLALLAIIAAINTVAYFAMLRRGVVVSGVPVPVTALTALAMLLLIAGSLRHDVPAPTRRDWIAIPALVGVWFIAFSLLQFWLFGKTSYARPADAIVVLGARVYADGRCSDALADRVRTGAALYHQRLAPRLIMSGGPGDGAIDEPTAMRNFAVSLGVPEGAIELDRTGVNTRGTIDALDRNHPHDRLLAVSHFYHLPRIKLAAEQAGVRVYTVPAKESYTLTEMPRYIAREVAAFWAYAING